MKGLPLSYSKDMQEDKEQVFDAIDSLALALAAARRGAAVIRVHDVRETVQALAVQAAVNAGLPGRPD